MSKKKNSSHVTPIDTITNAASTAADKVNEISKKMFQTEVIKTKKMEIFGLMDADSRKLNPIMLFDEIEKFKKQEEEKKKHEEEVEHKTDLSESSIKNISEDTTRDVEATGRQTQVTTGVELKEDGQCLRLLKVGGLAATDTLQLKTNLKQAVFVKQKGILHPQIIYNVLTFKWLNLAEDSIDEDDELDLRGQKVTEFTNVGLLSALVFTVWVTFQVNVDKPSKPEDVESWANSWLIITFSVSWALAAGLTIFATILSVLMILALNEATTNNQVEYFIYLLNKKTFGIGSVAPLLLLYCSILLGSLGSFFWHLQKYGYSISAYAGIAALWSTAFIFIFFISSIVSSLMCAVESGRYLDKIHNTVIVLQKNEIEELFQDFLLFLQQNSGITNQEDAIELVKSPQQFVNYVKSKTSGLQFGKVTELKLKACAKQKIEKIIKIDFPGTELGDEHYFS